MINKMKPQLACRHRLIEAAQMAGSRLNRFNWRNAATALLGLSLLLAATAWAQDAVLVKDIRPGAINSLPEYHTNANGVLFFSANDGTNGFELWKSDGTAAGTVMVKDINPGAGHSTAEEITNVNGTVFFRAKDGINGVELWKSDGTAAGTVLVKDINPGPGHGGASGLTNVNGTLFFGADDGVNGAELWKSDGTAAGTVLVKDINPGPSGSSAGGGINVNGTLFFIADDGTNGFELWKSDGTAAGTVLVKDINPGPSHSFISFLTNVNGTLFFRADDGFNGEELWKSDGTAAGTVLVKDINSGAGSSDPGWLTNVNGTLFFSADDITNGNELWKSDGTAAGTVLVKDIGLGDSGSFPFMLTNVNGLLFFSPDDGVNGYELWQSDGTAAGTFLLKDINPGPSGSSINFPYNLNGVLFFQANDGTNGVELWNSLGTAGTMLVEDINPGAGSSEPDFLINVNGTLFFNANDGSSGMELWAVLNSPAGSGVVVKPQDSVTGENPVTLTFDNITDAGATTLNMSNTGPASPAGFSLGTPPTFYDLSTSAAFTGNIEVCIDYMGIAFVDESALKLFHFESGAWVDVTTSLNTTTNIICGQVTSLSPFAIFEPVTGKTFVFLANKVTLKQTKQTTPAGDIHSNSTLTIEKGTPSTYNSNLTAVGKITINKQNTINGDLTSATAISNFGTITGTPGVGPVDTEPLPSLSYSAGGMDKTVPSGGSLTLAPDSYGIVTLNGGGTLKLTSGSGDYFMNELRYPGSTAVIEIDLSSGDPVTINVVSNLQLGREVEIRLLPNGEDDSELVSFNTLQSTAVSIGKEAYFLGTLNASNANVTLLKNSQLRGAICANEILVERDCLFLHHESSGSLPGPGNLPKSSTDDEEETLASELRITDYALEQNYPNPFNPSTTIKFALPEAGAVRLAIYNSNGQLVRTLYSGEMPAGRFSLEWDGTNEAGERVASGVYLAVFKAGDPSAGSGQRFVAQRKLVLMK